MCFGRDWYVFTDEEEERIIKKLKKEKKEMKANGKLEKWEEGRTWKY